MLDSIYHMTLRLLKSHVCCKKRYNFVIMNVVMDVMTFPEIYKLLAVYRFYCMALFYSQTRRHMINIE